MCRHSAGWELRKRDFADDDEPSSLGLDSIVDAQREASVQCTVEVLEQALRGFALPPADLAHAAHTLRSALHGFVSYELGHSNPASVDVDESLGQLVHFLCVSFQAKGNAS